MMTQQETQKNAADGSVASAVWFDDFVEKRHKLQQRREELKSQKFEIDSKLSAIKNQIRSGGRMEQSKYKTCCDAQSKYSHKKFLIEKELGKLKVELGQIEDEKRKRELSGELYTASNQERDAPVTQQPPKAAPDCVRELVALRTKYQDFAADHTRVSSMRQMAAAFANELDPIIKRAVSSNK